MLLLVEHHSSADTCAAYPHLYLRQFNQQQQLELSHGQKVKGHGTAATSLGQPDKKRNTTKIISGILFNQGRPD